jgi:hypothetical protein
MGHRLRQWIDPIRWGEPTGLHLAANAFVATAVSWLVLHMFANLNPVRATRSRIATRDSVGVEARKN